MRVSLLVLLLVVAINVNAQYEKGNWYLSGNSVVDTDDQTTVAGADFTSASRSGYFLLDRLLVGGSVLDPAAFVRYYQPLKPQGKLSAFAELNVTLDFGGFRNRVSYQPAIGLEYRFSPDILLSATLQQTFSETLFRATSLQFGINTIIGRGGLEPGQNLLNKGSIFIDPNIGQIEISNITPSRGGIEGLGFGLHFGGGLMLSDRISLDGSISLNRFRADYRETSVPANIVINNEVAADLGLRYFVTERGKFRPYVGAGVSSIYRYQEVDYEPQSSQPDFTENDLDVAPYLKLGALFFLSDKIALDAGLEYNFIDVANSRTYNNRLGLGIGMKIFLEK
jgi:hypothetical protein